MSYIKCRQCEGVTDHAPGGPFCKVISKVAYLQVQNNDLQIMIREKDKLIDDLASTLDDLRFAFNILKETHLVMKSGNA